MKKLAAVLPCFIAGASMAADVSFEQLHKQLDIMNNIIKSSVTSGDNRQNIKLSGVESTYLKGQGVLFTLRSQSRFGHWGNYNFDVVMPPMPPMPPLSPDQIVDIETTVAEAAEIADIDVEKEVAKAMENASRTYERVIEIHHDKHETYRDLREEQRDLAYELRDITREKRDMEYQLKRSEDKEDKAELKSELAALEKKKKKILASKKELTEKAKQIKSKQLAEQSKQETARKGYYENLSAAMAETLCLYGNGLKALPKGENVTVILKSGGDKLGRQYQDKIHVFTKRNINGCAIDKITSTQLLEKSKAYQF
ncbi:hypothetical protein HII17_05465 [Thalassotalea sp. M1531]|uniref:Uncharacterized protein n=1 Tax=Thalassotalea algicola TaxID=2716224 RepID=A0A7Y0Q646_9GAMM|nr:hypothetical protein [Thalassotalea algicola]NMP31008.1 hypothetical protein [Thalassotalea algicola]